MKKVEWGNFIHSDPSVLLGKPVVKGTRLSAEFILGLYTKGWTEDQILENYPNLTKESLLALEHAIRPQDGKEFIRSLLT